jgi:RNA polymerase sigma-70 factor, ECF subfamily
MYVRIVSAAPADTGATLPLERRIGRYCLAVSLRPGCVRFVTLEMPPSMTIQGERLDAVVADAVAGDRDALREVLETIRPIVVRYCRARVGTAERSGLSADDVAQEVCLAAITALPRYRDQGRPFLAFVYGIAAHKVADAHRAAGRDLCYPVDSVPEHQSLAPGPEQLAILADSTARMSELLEVLPAKQREILILRVVVGLSAEETASALGTSPGAVRVAQHRALARLKSELIATGRDYG